MFDCIGFRTVGGIHPPRERGGFLACYFINEASDTATVVSKLNYQRFNRHGPTDICRGIRHHRWSNLRCDDDSITSLAATDTPDIGLETLIRSGFSTVSLQNSRDSFRRHRTL